MSIDFVRFGAIVLLKTPVDVELSVWIGDGGCGNIISMSVWRSGTICFSVMNIPESAA